MWYKLARGIKAKSHITNGCKTRAGCAQGPKFWMNLLHLYSGLKIMKMEEVAGFDSGTFQHWLITQI